MTGELELVFGMVLCYFTVSGTVILFTWSSYACVFNEKT